jgi:hypothetical protein
VAAWLARLALAYLERELLVLVLAVPVLASLLEPGLHQLAYRRHGR